MELFLTENKGLTQSFLDSDQYPDISILANRLYNLIKNPYIDTLYKEVEDEYKDISQIEDELSTAFTNIKAVYPDFQIPVVQTVITGLYKDLFISDSLIVIGLDFFLGSEASYKPNPREIPSYMLERYTRDYMSSHIINDIALRYIQSTRDDNTMLAEMIDYGKSYFFTSQVLPCLDIRLIAGYDVDEYKEISSNEKIIWSSFLTNEVVYETSHIIKNKFIGERPKIPEIGNQCPGRIGRWIGYRILESYAKHSPEVTLKEVMETKNAKNLFLNSKYNPLR